MAALVTHLQGVTAPADIERTEWEKILTEISTKGLEAALKSHTIPEISLIFYVLKLVL